MGNIWSPGTDLSVPRSRHGVAVMDGVLYCVGGRTNLDCYTNTVEKYNEDTKTWSLVAEMIHSRQHPGVLTHEGRLYVLGGRSYRHFFSSVEMYDPVTNTWTLATDMSTGREGPVVALINRSRTD